MATGDLAPMFRALWKLEQDVSAVTAAEDPRNELRHYPWRPNKYPELPAIWNWVDDGSVEVPETHRMDDVIIVTVSIGVAATVPEEDMDRLVTLVDHFRHVVDPALKTRVILPDPEWDPDDHGGEPAPGSARAARRLLTRTEGYEWDDGPVIALDTLIRVDLARMVA